MIWTPEPWQGLLMMLGLGVAFIILGIIPLLPKYKTSRQNDPTHWSSHFGSIILGVIVIVWGLIIYFG